MTDLKPVWEQVSLGDVVDVVTEYWDRDSTRPERFVAGEHIDEGDLRVRRWGMTDDELVPPTFNRRFRAGDVLFHSRNVKKLACPDFGGITGEKLFVIRSRDTSRLMPELLPFVLQTDEFNEYANRMSAGSTNKFLNKAPLVKYEITLPPLKEQRGIARALAAAEQTLQAALSASRPLNAITRRLLEGFDLAAVPTMAIADLLLENPKNGVSPTCNGDNRGRPTLPVGCVYSGVVNTQTDLKYAEIDDDTFERFRLRRDDILVVRGNGNRDLVGRAGIVEDEVSSCFFPDLLIRLRFNPEILDPRLAIHLWNCVPIHAGLVRRAKSTNGIYKINGGDIKAHRLPVPSTEQQARMLSAVARHDAAVTTLNARVANAQRVKVALLGMIALPKR